MPDTEYSRGREAGTTETRLEGHDDRLHAINGNIANFVEQMGEIKLLLQSVKDTVRANTEAALATAVALEKAESARLKKAEESWDPMTKLFAIVAAISSVVAIYLGVRH